MEKTRKKLTEIAIGQEVTLVDFENELSKNQLMEMGCTPGMRLKREYDAPFGDPLCIYTGGYFLMLRRKEADQIIVEE